MTESGREAPAGATGRAWPWFLAWAVTGALGVLGVLAILSIGFVLIAAAGFLAYLLLRSADRSRVGLAGLLSGAAAPVAYVAWNNRDGPGEVCHPISGGVSCTTEWNPLPWWVVAGVLLVAGVVVFVVQRSGYRPHRR